MNRRDVIVVAALGGSGVIAGNSLYGSSNLGLERSGDSTVVRKDSERIDSLTPPVDPVEDDDALLGISIPSRTTVQTVGVGIVWAIRRDGFWSDVIVQLSVTGDVGAALDPGVATAYSSPWGSPSEAEESTSSNRRYAYPRGTTAGRVDTSLSVVENSDAEEEVVEVEAQLSARSVSGTSVERTSSAELTVALD